VVEPVFESQTKTKLGSVNVAEGGPTMRNFIGDFFQKNWRSFYIRIQQLLKNLKNVLNKVKEKEKNFLE
jgi:topoisomerase-4 subunit B